MCRMELAFLVVLGALFTAPGLAREERSGTCTRVVDGDTVHVTRGAETEIIRLYAIDCPEKGDVGYVEAKMFAETHLLGKEVWIKSIRKGAHGRTDGILYVDGVNFNLVLLENGLARVWHRYCGKDELPEWIKSENIARAKQRGIWAADACESEAAPLKGNPRTGKYHTVRCRYYSGLKDGILFPDGAAALGQGFRPCGICCRHDATLPTGSNAASHPPNDRRPID